MKLDAHFYLSRQTATGFYVIIERNTVCLNENEYFNGIKSYVSTYLLTHKYVLLDLT